MKNDLIFGLTVGNGKLRKTAYKMISRNMRNRDDELVQHLNCHAIQISMGNLIYKAMKNNNY
jgi:hypothetical protein